MASYLPYRVKKGAMSISAIAQWCKAVNQGMAAAGLANEFDVYERLTDHLTGSTRFVTRPLAEFLQPVPEKKVAVFLRHDVDGDVMTGLRAARHLTANGLSGSFYLLHSSHYYGFVEGKVFFRQRGLKDLVKQYVATDQEIGLHIDPLHFYFEHGIDGTAAMVAELAYLRGLNASIKGVAAHNSAPVYGAENFEIFKDFAFADKDHVTKDGKSAPLHTVTLGELGLEYEGNYPGTPDLEGTRDASRLAKYLAEVPVGALQDPVWQETYFVNNPVFSRPNDVSAWLVGRDHWVLAHHHPTKELMPQMTTDQMLAKFDEMAYGARLVISVHPEYVGGCGD